MKISSMNWMQVEDYLREKDSCVIPVGSTEQHAYLSLATDSILAERIAVESADPLGIPVFPVMPYGMTPDFLDYPGTVSLRKETLENVFADILDSLYHHGFRKMFIVNGHGGNMPLEKKVKEWCAANSGSRVFFYNWWREPKTWAKVCEKDTVGSHASWMENFAWTRLAGVQMPGEAKPMIELSGLRGITPAQARELMGDGNWGGEYQKPDDVMADVWNAAVEEAREELEKFSAGSCK